MPLGAHLRELRKRMVLIFIGVALGTVGGWFLFDPLYDQMTAPLDDIGSITITRVGQGFNLRLMVSALLGVFLTTPWWFGQIWAFIAPGLKRKEKLYSAAFIAAGSILFVGGGMLAWWILPRAIRILLGFAPEMSENLLDASYYFSFFLKITIFFGVAFLLPLFMVGLNFLGIISASAMLRGWRWAVLVSFTFTAMANPLPDAWSMIVMGSAITALFFLAIGIAFIREWIIGKRPPPEDEFGLSSSDPDPDGSAVDSSTANAGAADPGAVDASAVDSSAPDAGTARG